MRRSAPRSAQRGYAVFVVLSLGVLFLLSCADEGELTTSCDEHSDCRDGWVCEDVCLPLEEAEDFLLISELDDEGIDRICEEIEEQWHQLSPQQYELLVCAVGSYIEGLDALSEGDDAIQECRDYRQGCYALEEPQEWECMARRLTAKERSGCDATVYRYHTCEEEMLAGYRTFGDRFVCEEIQEDGSLADPGLDNARSQAGIWGTGLMCRQFFEDCALD